MTDSNRARRVPGHWRNEGRMSERMEVLVVTERGEGEQKKNYWTRVGAAFPQRDGGPGWTLLLDFPVAVTKLVLRPPKEPANDRPSAGYRGGGR